MSYCRWSCDDFQCDIYCYEAEDGFVVHVAGNRWVPASPLPPEIKLTRDNFKEWFARSQVVSEMLEGGERRPIGLPHDGESFGLDTASECADKLIELREIGYNVPSYAIEALQEEAAADE